MPRPHRNLSAVITHVHTIDRANKRLGATRFLEMSDRSALSLARIWHRGNTRDVRLFLSEGTVPYDPAGRLWPALLPAPYLTLTPADQLLADYLGTYLLHWAGRGPQARWNDEPVDDLRPVVPDAEEWCVVTESGAAYLVPYRGYSGFGPVNVWHHGTLVPLRSRHRTATDRCPACTDPAHRRAYLPPARWRTPEPTGVPRRIPLDPHRGQFHAVFSGGPDHPSRQVTADVTRQTAWSSWTRYARVQFSTTGDWMARFDRWRADATGYRPPDATAPAAR